MDEPTLTDVAVASGTSTAFVSRLVDAGILRQIDDDRFPADAAAVARAAQALDAAGFGPDVVGEAIREGHLALEFLGHWFVDQSDSSAGTYGAFVESLADRGFQLGAVYTAFGLPEPDPAKPLASEERELLEGFLEIWSALSPSVDAPVRSARIVGEGMRRTVEAFLDLWDEEAQVDGRPTDRPPVSAPGGELSTRMAALLPSLLMWLHRRHAAASVEGRIIRSFEDSLEQRGRLPRRTRTLPAIAFVDLAGYTALTEQSGDASAVRSALRLQELSALAATSVGGRLVKLLGDGVILRFPTAEAAVKAVSGLLPRLLAEKLPAGHAGLAAGPIVDRDGDVFGRTVNLAARLAAEADPGQILATAEVAQAVKGSSFRFVRVGDRALKGFDAVVSTWQVETEPAPRPV